jgi:filamentous hemagglutinin family protein
VLLARRLFFIEKIQQDQRGSNFGTGSSRLIDRAADPRKKFQALTIEFSGFLQGSTLNSFLSTYFPLEWIFLIMLASKFVAKKIISTSTRNLLASTAIGCALALPSLAYAQNLPTGGSVAAGSVAISQSSATHLNITQSSQSAVVNWQGFSVGQGSSVNFAQPNASSAILNRVTGSASSTIAGSITANGQVYLVNPNGIAITASGSVNAGGGFVASTLGISDGDFMSGKRSFSGNGASARVSNAGSITVGRGGYAALIGGTVSNSGSISVPLGKVALGSGERATLDFSGDGFLQVAVPTGAGGKGALIRNSGSIKADGGSVIISAATAREAARSAINISGLVQARSISGHNGSIMIGDGAGGRVRITGRLIATSRHYAGGSITVTGKDIALKSATVDASGATGGGNINIGGGRQGTGPLQHADTTTIDATTTIKADAISTGNGGNVVVWSDLQTNFAGTISARGGALSGNGGSVETSSAAHLEVADTARVYTLAGHGAAGNWLLDPQDFTIAASGGDMTGATLSANLANGSVTILSSNGATAGSGDIFVNDAVGWSSGSLLTLTAVGGIAVNAPISITGGGQLALNYSTNLSLARGASIDYGTTNNGGKLSINGTPYTLLYNMTDVANVNTTGLGGAYALATNLNAAGNAYQTPVIGSSLHLIGNGATGTPSVFSGTLEGLGHSISNLTIDSTGYSQTVNGQSQYVTVLATGLIGTLTGAVRDLNLVGGHVYGNGNVGSIAGNAQTGGIISQSSASISVIGNSKNVGGLVGRLSGASITDSFASGNVQVTGGGSIGGLVGYAYQGATITRSYATGGVNGSYFGQGFPDAGGLVGHLEGSTVTQSYATGPVLGGSNVGGLVGNVLANSTVSLSYSTGDVRGSSAVGGLVGNNAGSVTQSYWDINTSGQPTIGIGSGTGSVTGLTTRQLKGLDPLSGSGSNAVYFSTATNLGDGTTSAFGGGANGLYPYLTDFFPNGVQVVSGIAYQNAAGTSTASSVGDAPVTAYLDVNGQRIGQANAGANGYYYIAVANGSLAAGANVLVSVPKTYSMYTAQFSSGVQSQNAATIITSNGATLQSGVNLLGNTLTATTSATTLSQANLSFASDSTSDSTATGIVNALSGYNLTATGASFKIDQGVTTSGIFSVTTQTGSPLTVAAPIEIDGSGSLGLLSGGALAINAPITVTGAGSVNLAAAKDTTTVAGMPLLELSFAQGTSLQFTGTPNSGQALTINGAAYTLIYTATDLGAVNNNLSGNYALAKPLDLGTTTYTDAVIAGSTAATGFLGKFDGLGNTISNLTIVSTVSGVVGLFGQIGDASNNSAGTVENIGLIGGSVTSSSNNGFSVGALAGTNTGTILNAYATTSVTGNTASGEVGGLVGYNWGVMTNVHASGTVIDTATLTGGGSFGGNWVGGLVGYNDGYTPANGGGVGTITNAYATGAVTGGGGAGGANIYGSTGSSTGGLVGVNLGTINNAYATGVVSGGSVTYLGGLVGENDTLDGPATVNHGYWDTATTGIGSLNHGAGTGLTTRQLQGLDPITGTTYFSVLTNLGNRTTSAFSGGANGLYPYLTSFFPNGVQAITGTAKTAGGAGISGGQVGIYSGGTLLTGGTTTTGANGYFYEIVPTGTLASSSLKIGETLSLAGASSVSGLSYTDAAAASGSVFALGTLTNGFNRQTTAETTYGALQTDLGATFGITTLATLNTALASTPTGITATGAGFTLDQDVNAGADFSLTTTAANAAITFATNLNASGHTVTLNSSGAITQSGGAITAGTLTGSSKGTVSLNQAGNAIGALGAFTAGTGDFSLTDNVTNLAVSGVITVTTGNLSLTNSGGAIALNAGAVTTGGSQTFTTAVTLGADTTLSGSTISFDSTLDGAHALTITGNAMFGGTVGATTKLTSLSVSGTSALDGSGITTTGTQTYSGAATLGANATLGGSTIFFDSTLDGAHALTVTGNAAFDGTVGATTKLVSLSVSGTSALNGSGITTTGTQTYSGATTLGADTTLKSSSAVSFGSTIDGAYSLAVGAAGDVTFGGAVGATTALASLTANSGGATTLDGGVTTTGAVTLTATGNLTLAAGARIIAGTNSNVILSATGNFINNRGSDAISVSGTGRWLVYSNNPGADAFGNLDSGNAAIWNTTYPTSIAASGNRYVFAYQPTVTLSAGAITKTYGDVADLSTDYTVSGLQGVAHAFSDTAASAFSGTPVITSAGAAGNADVSGSPYLISIAPANVTRLDGYAIAFGTGSLTVTQRAVTVTADAQSKTYGDANPVLTFTTSSLGAGAAVAGSLANSATASSDVGSYAITQGTVVNANNPNYLISYVGNSLTVNQRAVTVTADAQSKSYGDANPALTFTTSSLGAGAAVAGTLATSATGSSDVGSYGITQGTVVNGNNPNYLISYVGANLVINQRAVTVTADAKRKSYGDANPALTFTTSSLGAGAAIAGSLATFATASSDVGSYAITQGSVVNANNPNYLISYVGNNLVVNQRAVTVTADAQSKTYGDANPALTFTTSSLGAGTAIVGSLTTPTTASSGVSSYAITQGSVINANNPNYRISYVGNSLTVNQRAVTVSADAKPPVTYGDAIPALTFTTSSLGAGAAIVGSLTTSATPSSGIGSYAITQGSVVNANNPNYVISYVGTNLTITPRPLTVTADPQNKAFGDPNPPLTYTVGGRGLVNGDTLSGALATVATPQSDAGSYAITQATLAASRNYALTYFGANLTVTPAVSNSGNGTTKSPVNPVVVAGTAYQTPKTTSINFVTTQGTPGPLTGFTRSASNTNTNTNTKTAANPDDIITGAIGKAVAPSADGLTYKPISQYDASQYAAGTLPDHVDQAGLATILTMIARAATHDVPPTIDQLFDPAKGADWHGVGWQNPLVDKVKFSTTPQGSEPGADTALALDGNTDLGALLGKGPVILAGKDDKSWLLAVAITEAGIVANDPVTGQRVLLGYDSAKKTVGPISRIFDPAANKWVALKDAATAGIGFVDAARAEALKTFAADKYLTITVAK